MKKLSLLFSLVALLFVSCDTTSTDDEGGVTKPSNPSVNANRIAAVVVNDIYYEDISGVGTNDAKLVLYLTYDEQNRIELIHHIIVVDNMPKQSTAQRIIYGTPVTITSRVQEIVKYTNPDKTVLREYEGTGGEARFNSLGYLSSYSYGGYYSCSITYDATTHRMIEYTGGSGHTTPFVWEDGNVIEIEGLPLTYTDQLATWGGFDWFFMMANGFEEDRIPLYVLNTNRGLHSKNLPNTISAYNNTEAFIYTFDDRGVLKTIEFDDEVINLFYEGELIPEWQWEPYDEVEKVN